MTFSKSEGHRGGQEPALDDEDILAHLGYKQHFQRKMNTWSVGAFCFSIMAILGSFATTLNFPITNGGNVGVVWGWFTASCFATCVSFSLAELCSSMPTVGGIYYWSAHLAPRRWSPLAAWVTGWANLVGQVALICSICSAIADEIADAVTIASDFQVYYSSSALYGIMIAVLVADGMLSSCSTRITARLNYLYMAVNLGGVIALIIILAVLGPKNSASVAFSKFENNSEWENKGLVWILSLTAAMWTLTGYDSAAHVAEETSNAAHAGPIAMVSAVVGTALTGFILSIVHSFVMQDPSRLLSAGLKIPAAQLYYDVMGKHGCLAMWSIIIFVQFTSGAAQTLDASRALYAFARDGAVPFSHRIATINSFTGTPVNATWTMVLFTAIVGLLELQSTALTALAGTSVIGLYVSYAVPIFLRITSGRNKFRPGPWNLGRAAIPLGIISCLWVSFIVVVLLFPANPNPDASLMNWAVLILGVIFSGAMLAWIVSARHWFRGPIHEVEWNDKEDRQCDMDTARFDDEVNSKKPDVELTDFVA
ncbi:hypothetical protein MPSI1_003683 [Malassezia psittaci]|uniref:Amino acid transporter n=1 Tax=Malassezia psittaci TaxID=1821823 RepID=A0AAF0FI84_9BASI|nr:hypothetical protein MPSI1_003683 [Malassezia psittaci]